MRCVEVSESTGITEPVVTSSKVRLQAVYGTGQDDANKEWSKWTPSGEVMLQITNPDAFKQFKIGQCYFVDFTPVE